MFAAGSSRPRFPPIVACRSLAGESLESTRRRWFGDLRWRDNVGHEIDLLFETGDRLQPVEIKSGMTFSCDWLDAAKRWKAIAGDAALDPWIIHGGRGFSWRALRKSPV